MSDNDKLNDNNFFVTKGRYAVCLSWYYGAPEESFENCSIYQADAEDEENDGNNLVSRGGA